MDQFVIVLAIIFLTVAISSAVFFAYNKVIKNKKNYASGRTQNGDLHFDDVCSSSKYLKLTNVE